MYHIVFPCHSSEESEVYEPMLVMLQGSGGDADGRREVRGLDGVVAADVQRGEAAARPLPLAPQHTGCGARVRWLPSSAGGEARGRHRPGPAGAESQGEGRDGVATQGGGCRRSGVARRGCSVCFVVAAGREIRPGRRRTLSSDPIFGSDHNN